MAEQAVFEPKAVIARDREFARLLCAIDGATAGSDREEPAASSLAEHAANDREDRAAA